MLSPERGTNLAQKRSIPNATLRKDERHENDQTEIRSV